MWAEGIEKGIPGGVMDGLPTVALGKLIRAWKGHRKLPFRTRQVSQGKGRVEPKSNEMVLTVPQTPTAPEKDLIDLRSGN